MHADDTDLYVFDDSSSDSTSSVQKAQLLLDSWHKALGFTGGDLKVSKYYWALQDYRWTNGKCVYSRETSHALTITSNSVSKAITHIPPNAMRTLVGVPIVPSNDPAPVIEHFKEKIAEHIPRLQHAVLTIQDVLFGYEKFWIPSLLYSAPVLALPHSANLLAPLHKIILPKLRVMRTFPTVMRAALIALGSLGLWSLEIECGVQAIQHFISLFLRESPSKLLLVTTIEHHQLEIGVESLFLDCPFPLLSPLATSTWITHLWEFLHLHNLRLHISSLNLPTSSCSNNSPIITHLISSGWSGNNLRIVNQVRIWLQIYFISDLLVLGTNIIKRCFLQGIKDMSSSSKFK